MNELADTSGLAEQVADKTAITAIHHEERLNLTAGSVYTSNVLLK
jgi:hypothetical protein